MPYVYILECGDGSFYTGSTIDLRKRLAEHHNGIGAKYMRSRLPVKLVYCEEYPRVDTAFRREKQVQNWSHKKKNALIKGSDKRLKNFAKCRNATHCVNAPGNKCKKHNSGHLDSAR